MIPKDIYICHKNLDDLEKYSEKWKILNPDMTIHLYDDEMCKKFFRENFPPLFLEIFLFIKHGPIKADFWRLCILYIYGGCYVDADIEPFVPLNEYISFDEYFVTCLSHFNQSYNPHIILCEKHNNILVKCINEYIKYYVNKVPYSYDRWSVVHIFSRILGFRINKNISGEYIINNKKLKFLKEQNFENSGRQFCNYEGRIVLSNRYVNYINHQFISENELYNPNKKIKQINNTTYINIPKVSSNNSRFGSITMRLTSF
jgi:mannosyltransferase OCH1-like enzyme